MQLPPSVPPLPDRTTIRLRPGVNRTLEDAADEIIRHSLKGVTSRSAKSDILTPWKQKDRWQKEVYTSSGIASEGRRGMFHRALNRRQTHLNAREGTLPARRGLASLEAFVDSDAYGDEDSRRGYAWENC